MPGPFSGLSVKLIATITLVILAVEVVIYLPSAGNYRAVLAQRPPAHRHCRRPRARHRARRDEPAGHAHRQSAELGGRHRHRLSPQRHEPADRARRGAHAARSRHRRHAPDRLSEPHHGRPRYAHPRRRPHAAHPRQFRRCRRCRCGGRSADVRAAAARRSHCLFVEYRSDLAARRRC